jgi:hypothetical protein
MKYATEKRREKRDFGSKKKKGGKTVSICGTPSLVDSFPRPPPKSLSVYEKYDGKG